MNKFNIGDLVEFKDKNSTGKFTHTNIYRIIYHCKMKNPSTREWNEAYTYMKVNSKYITEGEKFIRERSDMENKFKIVDK